MKNGQVELQELSDRQVAYVSYKGNYMANVQVFKDLFDKLCGWAGPKGMITPESVFLSAYRDDPHVTPPEELRLEVCLTVPKGAEVEGDVQKQVLPGGKYAVMSVELDGPEEYGPAWMAVVDWAKENNLTIDGNRPSYEIYKNNPEEHPEKHHILDICLGVIE